MTSPIQGTPVFGERGQDDSCSVGGGCWHGGTRAPRGMMEMFCRQTWKAGAGPPHICDISSRCALKTLALLLYMLEPDNFKNVLLVPVN